MPVLLQYYFLKSIVVATGQPIETATCSSKSVLAPWFQNSGLPRILSPVSRLEYCASLFAGLPRVRIERLARIAAARLIGELRQDRLYLYIQYTCICQKH